MQIQLKQREIELAITNFITSQGINLEGKEIDISFTAGRGTSGIQVELNVDNMFEPRQAEIYEVPCGENCLKTPDPDADASPEEEPGQAEEEEEDTVAEGKAPASLFG